MNQEEEMRLLKLKLEILRKSYSELKKQNLYLRRLLKASHKLMCKAQNLLFSIRENCQHLYTDMDNISDLCSLANPQQQKMADRRISELCSLADRQQQKMADR